MDTPDAILLESNGHFAMAEAGSVTDHPLGLDWLNLSVNEVRAGLFEDQRDEFNGIISDIVCARHLRRSDQIGSFDLLDLDLTAGNGDHGSILCSGGLHPARTAGEAA